MAVTNNGNRIILAAAADAITERVHIQAILLDHSAAVNCVLQDTASKEIITLRNTTSELSKMVYFPCGLVALGVKASTLSGGKVTLFLK